MQLIKVDKGVDSGDLRIQGSLNDNKVIVFKGNGFLSSTIEYHEGGFVGQYLVCSCTPCLKLPCPLQVLYTRIVSSNKDQYWQSFNTVSTN